MCAETMGKWNVMLVVHLQIDFLFGLIVFRAPSFTKIPQLFSVLHCLVLWKKSTWYSLFCFVGYCQTLLNKGIWTVNLFPAKDLGEPTTLMTRQNICLLLKTQSVFWHWALWSVTLGVFSVLSHPYMKSGLEIATKDVRKAGASGSRMSRSWRLVVNMLAKSTRERECRCRFGVPTPVSRSFRELSNWSATCSRTGVCHICHRCWDTARIATSNSMTLLWRDEAEIEGPRF